MSVVRTIYGTRTQQQPEKYILLTEGIVYSIT